MAMGSLLVARPGPGGARSWLLFVLLELRVLDLVGLLVFLGTVLLLGCCCFEC